MPWPAVFLLVPLLLAAFELGSRLPRLWAWVLAGFLLLVGVTWSTETSANTLPLLGLEYFLFDHTSTYDLDSATVQRFHDLRNGQAWWRPVSRARGGWVLARCRGTGDGTGCHADGVDP